MKRFLSWLTLLGCVIAIILFTNLVMLFLSYALSLYDQLSAFLKLVVIVIGGSFFLGLVFAPIFYGIPLSVTLSEKVFESKRGARYIVFGIIILLYSLFELFVAGISIARIILGIYAIVLMIVGRKTAKENTVIA